MVDRLVRISSCEDCPDFGHNIADDDPFCWLAYRSLVNYWDENYGIPDWCILPEVD